MGGCCCCPSNLAARNHTPAYYYYPGVLDEQFPLSSSRGTSSVFSPRLLVDTNLDTSIPDTYTPPPAPIPFDVALRHRPNPPRAIGSCAYKNDSAVGVTNFDSDQETVGGNAKDAPEKYGEQTDDSNCKLQTDLDLDLESAIETDKEVSKWVEPMVSETDEEDACPICLEEYDAENPKLTTQCEHYFHLACILEWMERSETCPVCNQETISNLPD